MTENAELLKELKQQRKLASTIDRELLECRVGATGHRWQRCQPDVPVPTGQNLRVDQCDNCDMIRRTFSGARYGEVIARRYVEPEGYYLKRPEGYVGKLLTPAAVRLTVAETPEGLPEVRHPGD